MAAIAWVAGIAWVLTRQPGQIGLFALATGYVLSYLYILVLRARGDRDTNLAIALLLFAPPLAAVLLALRWLTDTSE